MAGAFAKVLNMPYFANANGERNIKGGRRNALHHCRKEKVQLSFNCTF